MRTLRRLMVGRGAVVWALLLATAAGCARGPAPTSAPAADVSPAPVYQPVDVAGVDSCDELPTGTSGMTDGDRLPELRLPCLVPGPEVNLADLGGKPVLINLWATWCGPCREEMPILQDAHTRYGDEVAFLGLDTKDDPERAGSFLEDVGVTYPQLVDLDGRLLSEHHRVPGLPVTVVVDADGRVVKKHVGPFTEESLDALIREVVDG
jgi:cytochrome c biogenesis protein CcmG/thiol:disulfide interchange protein DsbE